MRGEFSFNIELTKFLQRATVVTVNLAKNLIPSKKNQKSLFECCLDLAIVLNFYYRRIVGSATSDRLKKDLALTALSRAIAIRQPGPELIHYSYRGSQYCSYEYWGLYQWWKTHSNHQERTGLANCVADKYGGNNTAWKIYRRVR